MMARAELRPVEVGDGGSEAAFDTCEPSLGARRHSTPVRGSVAPRATRSALIAASIVVLVATGCDTKVSPQPSGAAATTVTGSPQSGTSPGASPGQSRVPSSQGLIAADLGSGT